MLHPLEQRLVALRRRRRRLAAIHGGSLAAAVLLMVLSAFCEADYLVRFEDRGLRILVSFAALGVAVLAARRILGSTLFAGRSDADLLRRVEQAFPQLQDRLQSAIEFLHLSDDAPAAGSAALRRATIAQVAAEAATMNFSGVLDVRRPARAVALLAAACLLAAAPVLASPSSSRIALARLLNPFGNAIWPRTGVPLQRQPVEPPVIESLEVRLVPPARSGLSAVSSERRIQALAGTQVRFVGRATKPLRAVELCFADGENIRKIPARLDADGRTFAAGGKDDGGIFAVERSGAYWIELTGREGVRGGDDDRWDIEAVADAPPTVAVLQPAADRFVTPLAVVPIRVSARDDLALREIGLAFCIGPGSAAPDRHLLLYSAPRSPPQRASIASAVPVLPGDRRAVENRWDLASLALRPGMQVVFRATALDCAGQAAEGPPRRLLVVAPGEMWDRLAERQAVVASELRRAVQIERECLAQLQLLRRRLADLPALRRDDLDRLSAVEHNQREALRLLTDRGEGVPMHIHAILADVEDNRLDAADLQKRLASLLDALGRLDREHLRPAGRELTAAVKAIQLAGRERSAAESAANRLAAAERHQASVIATLEPWIEKLTHQNRAGRLHRDVGRLLRDQDDTARRTVEAGRRTLARELRDLPPRDAAELKNIADDQRELAGRLDRLLQEMGDVAGSLRGEDSHAAETVAAAKEAAQGRLVGARMYAAAENAGRNRVGLAVAAQKQIARDLRDVLDILAGRRGDGRDARSEGRDSGGKREPQTATIAASKASTTPSESDRPMESARAAEGGRAGDARQPGGEAGHATAGSVTPRRIDAEPMSSVLNRLWGELPRRARRQMQQTPIEEMPPQYRPLIEDYFRRLAGKRDEGGVDEK